MRPPAVKLVVTDVDGTLTDQHQLISCKAIEAIRKLEARGIPVSLASGNTFCVMKTLKTYIGCSGPLICEGGGIVVLRDQVKILYSDKNVKQALASLKRKYGDKIVEAWSNQYRRSDRAILRKINKAAVLGVLGKYPSLKLVDSKYAYHIMEERADKSTALIHIMKALEIRREASLAIGDSETDGELLAAAGTGIALANAPRKLKQAATFVTKQKYGDGFAEAVEWITRS